MNLHNVKPPLRTYLTIVLSFIIAGLVSAAFGQECTLKTGGGEAKISCEAESVLIERHPEHNITRAVVSMAASTQDNAVAMVVATKSAGWNFSGEDTAYALIEGEKYQLEAIDGESSTEDGFVYEQKFVVVSPRTSVRLRNAEEIYLRLGDALFDVSSEVSDQMDVIVRRFASLE